MKVFLRKDFFKNLFIWYGVLQGSLSHSYPPVSVSQDLGLQAWGHWMACSTGDQTHILGLASQALRPPHYLLIPWVKEILCSNPDTKNKYRRAREITQKFRQPAWQVQDPWLNPWYWKEKKRKSQANFIIIILMGFLLLFSGSGYWTWDLVVARHVLVTLSYLLIPPSKFQRKRIKNK